MEITYSKEKDDGESQSKYKHVHAESEEGEMEEYNLNSNLLEIKVYELIYMKKMIYEYYGEGVFHKAVEDDLDPLFVRALDGKKMDVKEASRNLTCKEVLTGDGRSYKLQKRKDDQPLSGPVEANGYTKNGGRKYRNRSG